MLPVPDDIFERKYRIDRVLGKGAFASVYRAVVDEIDRVVAIKVLRPQRMGEVLYQESLERRFLREARMLSELQDPHTIRMYDYGRSEDGLLFMIFEFVDGKPLNELIHKEGPLIPRQAGYIAQQLLESLREAHYHNIVHRDLKPANVMVHEWLGDPNRVKLLDFGVAKDFDDATALTSKGVRVGTIRYMSPEQIRGDDLAPSSDLYSLGLVLYEMLTGHKAVGSDDMTVITQFHLRPDPIEFPRRLVMSPDMREFGHRLLAKRAADRFRNADEALRAFRKIDWESEADAYFDDFDEPLTLDGIAPPNDDEY